MRVLVTGANGFIGRALVRAMVAGGRLARADGSPAPIEELVLVDRSPVTAPIAPGLRVRTLDGDLRDEALLAQAIGTRPDSIFHLAATLTIDAENDPASGWAINMQLPWRLLEACRGASMPPRFVYASSIAVFGGRLPDAVGDRQFRTPSTSYGTAKAITEFLIDDYSRKGIVDGRALRLPVVLLRPPPQPGRSRTSSPRSRANPCSARPPCRRWAPACASRWYRSSASPPTSCGCTISTPPALAIVDR